MQNNNNNVLTIQRRGNEKPEQVWSLKRINNNIYAIVYPNPDGENFYAVNFEGDNQNFILKEYNSNDRKQQFELRRHGEEHKYSFRPVTREAVYLDTDGDAEGSFVRARASDNPLFHWNLNDLSF
jgi:hypothetical protein